MKYIDKNATLYLVAPSCGCKSSPYFEQLTSSISNLRNKGYEVIEGRNIFRARGVASNTAKMRALEIMEAFRSGVDVVWSVGGGEVMCEILPYLSFEELKKYPKWYVGYSDNTHLTYTLTTMCDFKTIYGVHATKLFEDEFLYEKKDVFRMLEGETSFDDYGYYQLGRYNKENPLEGYHLDTKSKLIVKDYNAPFEGILLGGCLDCLDFICMSKWDRTVEYIKEKGKPIIFYFEACDLNSCGIRRALFKMKSAGWFSNVSGFIIGRSGNSEKYFNLKPTDAYYKSLKEYGVPILLDCDLGHVGPSMPICNGRYARVSVVDNRMSIEYEK